MVGMLNLMLDGKFNSFFPYAIFPSSASKPIYIFSFFVLTGQKTVTPDENRKMIDSIITVSEAQYSILELEIKKRLFIVIVKKKNKMH